MKKFLKENIRLFLGVIIGILASSITAYAVNSYTSNQIRYQNNMFAIDNVSDALDDLYSYSKDKIDNYVSNNYSTEEQVVGTWIDGKPLYQKSGFRTLSSSNNWQELFSVDNSISVNNIFGYVHKTDNTADFYLKEYLPSDFTAIVAFWSSKMYINLWKSNGGTFDIYYTYQYTKTTDTATN